MQLLRKMSAKLGAMTARNPASSMAHGACSRLDPLPKFGAGEQDRGARRSAGRSCTKPGSLRHSSNRNGPNPVRSIRLRYCAGMIWSVSTSARSIGSAVPRMTVTGSMLSSSFAAGRRACRSGRARRSRPRPAGSPGACARPCPGGPRSCGWTSRRSARPAAAMSGFIPRHIEHPAPRHSNPASVKTRSSPSSSACCFTSADPGTTSARRSPRTVRPATMLGGRAQVLDPAVGARADEDRVGSDLAHRRSGREVHVARAPARPRRACPRRRTSPGRERRRRSSRSAPGSFPS